MSKPISTRKDRLEKRVPPRNQLYIDENGFRDNWLADGQVMEFGLHTGNMVANTDHIKLIAEKIRKTGRCKTLLIGVGEGFEIPELVKAVAEKLGKETAPEEVREKLVIDVFSITKEALSDAVTPYVKTNFSGTKKEPRFLESYEGSDLFNPENKYDFVIDKYGATAKSGWKTALILKMSELLDVDGIALVHTMIKKHDKIIKDCERFWDIHRRPEKDFEIENPKEKETPTDWIKVRRKK